MGILGSVTRGNKRNRRNSYTYARSSMSFGNTRRDKASDVASSGVLKTALSWVLGLGLGIVLLFGLTVGGLQLYRIATTSDFFTIRQIEIRGATHFSREAILKAAGIGEGINSLTVNIADVERGLRTRPWVASVAVKRRLPDAFEIRIREKIPSFWMLRDGVLHYADKQGRIIIPGILRECAALEKDVIFLGMMNRVEIWDKSRLEAEVELEENAGVEEAMDELGISL